MAVIKYRDSRGHIHEVTAVKGDKGEMGPRGPKGLEGPRGETGDKGGTLIKGSVPSYAYLISNNILYKSNIGDGYINKEDGKLYIVSEIIDENGNLSGYREWDIVDNFIPVKIDDLFDVSINENLKGGDILMFDDIDMIWTNVPLPQGEGNGAILKEDITLSLNGKTLGALKDNTTIKAGTTFGEFVKMVSIEVTPPTYKKPLLEITSDTNTDIEIGSLISPTLYINYDSGDAGITTKMELYKNEELIFSNMEIVESRKISIYELNNNDTYKVRVYYNEGIIKLDSSGKKYPIGHILKGYIEESITFNALWPYWNLALSSTNVPTANDLRSFNPTGIGFENVREGKIISGNDVKTIIFAYPRELGECYQIEYVGFDSHNEDAFNRMILEIPDMNLNNYKDYYVYYYTAPIFIGDAEFVLRL